MTKPTTEIARLYLRPGSNMPDPASEASGIWKESVTTLSTMEGFQASLFSVDSKDSDAFLQFLDWDSLAAHEAVMNSPAYGPFLERVGVIMARFPDLNHVQFSVYGKDGSEQSIAPCTALKNTYTVVEKFYFPASIGTAAVEVVMASLVRGACQLQGYKVAACGWLMEEVDHPAVGRPGRVLLLAIGFDNSQSAESFRLSQDHKETLCGVGAKADESWVVHFLEPVPPSKGKA